MYSYRFIMGVVTLVAALWTAPLLAQGSLPIAATESQIGHVDGDIEELKATVAAFRAQYDRQIEALEARIVELEESIDAAKPDPVDELSALRVAAQEAGSAAGTRPGTERAPTVARQKSLNRLNPEISATGIVSGIASDQDREEFQRGEFELDIQAALDPFSRTRWTIDCTSASTRRSRAVPTSWAAEPS